MAYIEAAQVQQWLEDTKLGVDQVDRELEHSAAVYCFAVVSEVTDTTSWTDSTNTPDLMLVLISMFVAAWTYERTYSESVTDQPSWANRLERLATTVLNAIADGSINLVDDPNLVSDSPAFYPDDLTGSDYTYDAMGRVIGLPGSEDIKFTMGRKF